MEFKKEFAPERKSSGNTSHFSILSLLREIKNVNGIREGDLLLYTFSFGRDQNHKTEFGKHMSFLVISLLRKVKNVKRNSRRRSLSLYFLFWKRSKS